MKKLIAVMLFAVMFLAACGADEMTFGDPVPVDQNIQYVIQADECLDNGDCELDQLCKYVRTVTTMDGQEFPVGTCQLGCSAEMKTYTATGPEGTVKGVKKVPGTDTCQREEFTGPDLGEMTCDMQADSSTYKHCMYIGTAQKDPTPTEPDVTEPGITDPKPTDPTAPSADNTFIKLKCCFAVGYGNIGAVDPNADYFAQAAASTFTVEDPMDWSQHADMRLDGHGCFVSHDHFTWESYALGWWVQLTYGKQHNDIWLGDAQFAPLKCWVDDVEVEIGPMVQECGYGIYDSVGVDCQL